MYDSSEVGEFVNPKGSRDEWGFSCFYSNALVILLLNLLTLATLKSFNNWESMN